MSNKSGTDIISIPKGGGALRGIGEKFSPDLHTGTGNYSVPIDLPQGRNGFQPSLNLVYSTGNGNSPFGLGWSMSIPGITRKTDKGVPLYDDDKDVFILSGNEDLVPVEINGDATRYQPRTEGSFARITHIKRPVDNIDYWDVRSKDGTVSTYGTPTPKNTEESATIVKPERREGIAEAEGLSCIFAWKLTETRDTFGNRVVFSYIRDEQQEDGPHRWDQNYLSEIRYVDYGDLGNPEFLISVRFHYEERPDPFSEYRPGFEIRTTKRCKKIEILTHQSGKLSPIKTYHMSYQDEGIMPAAPPLQNGASLLTQILVEGQRRGEPSEFMPPLDFNYGVFEPERRNFDPVAGNSLPPESLGHSQNELADLFGNGLPDIIKMDGGQVRYWRNLGKGSFDLPRTMRESPGGLNLADPDVQLIDANGDGRIDLMVTKMGMTGYYPITFNGEWDKRSFQKCDSAPSFNLEDPEVKLVDLNGDGVTDALRSGTSFECHFNHPKRGWRNTGQVQRRLIEDFPNVNFSDQHMKWADMTGDGLTDIVLVHDGRVDYWPALGWGEFAPRVTMQNNPRFPYGYDPKRILIGDVDGDGAADMIYVDNQKVTLWMNQGGNRWGEPIEIQGTPSVTDMDAVRLVDLLGTGVSGILWSHNANSLFRDSMFFLDFTGGHKPYLLEHIDNNMGSVTNIGYASSTRYYLQDRSEGFNWKTPLPFPVQVVAKVESIDEISSGKLTTEYTYHHGYWDGAEREFRGFGRVDQRDTEVFGDYHGQGMDPEDHAFESVELRHFSSPTETRTWFHLGPVGPEYGDWREIDYTDEYWEGDTPALMRNEETEDLLRAPPRRVARDAIRSLRGLILRTELFALDGSEREDKPYTVTENSYGIRETEAPAVDSERARIFFPFETAKRTTQWERGDKPMTQLSFTGDYDEYGQPRLQLSVAVPKGRDWRSHLGTKASEIYLSTRTVTRYAVPDDPELVYIVDRVAHSTAHQIKDDKHVSAFEFWQSVLDSGNDIIPPISLMPEIVSQTLNYYDGAAFNGAALGRIIDHGALMCSEQLILTEDIINAAYPEGRPPYLTEGVTVWTNDYPVKFQTLIDNAGYHYYAADTARIGGFYTKTTQNKYNNRGLIIGQRDPLENLTEIEPDQYSLFPGIVTPPKQKLLTQVTYDYQAMKPKEITDPNDNTTKFDYTPLGLLKTIHLSADKVRPSTLFSYDFNAFRDRRQPVYAHVTRFVHFGANGFAADLLSEAIETREYSDGFGRLLQTRAQGEEVIFGDEKFGGKLLDPQQNPRASNTVIKGRKRTGAEPNVVVSGWQIYDNKGRAVEKYEPFFSTGWTFARPVTVEQGQKAILEYDAVGRAFRTTNPDGSQQLTVYGKPENLAQPDNFEPTPWEKYAYDANDNAERTSGSSNAANTASSHYNTPTSVIVDALGRTVEQIERNGADSLNDWYHTKTNYDIRGNVLTIHDSLGRLAFEYTTKE
jgi:YD repeat-containing protein